MRLADQGRQLEALEKFQTAHGYYPSPNTLFNIARAEQLVGRRLDAVIHYREALRNPVLLPRNAELAKQYVAELERMLGRVVVTGPSGTKVTVTGGKELRLPMGDPLDVQAGTVVVHGEHDGTTYEGQALAVAGSTVILELKASAINAVAPRPSPEPPPMRGDHASPMRYALPIGLSALAVGALGGGVALAGASRSAVEDARTFRGSGACVGVNPACGRVHELADESTTKETWSYVLYVSAGVMASGAAIAWLAWPRALRSSGQWSPILGPRMSGLAYDARF